MTTTGDGGGEPPPRGHHRSFTWRRPDPLPREGAGGRLGRRSLSAMEQGAPVTRRQLPRRPARDAGCAARGARRCAGRAEPVRPRRRARTGQPPVSGAALRMSRLPATASSRRRSACTRGACRRRPFRRTTEQRSDKADTSKHSQPSGAATTPPGFMVPAERRLMEEDSSAPARVTADSVKRSTI